MAVNLKAYDPKNYKTEEAKLKGATALGTGVLTDMSVFERAATYLYCMGVADRVNKTNNPTPPGTIFRAFNTAFRSPENGSGRRQLADDSVDSWAISFSYFYEAGKLPGEHIEPMVARLMTEAKGGYTARGGMLRKMLAKHATTAPTEAEFLAFITPNPKKADENPLKSAAEGWLKRISDDAFVKPLADKSENPLKPFASLTESNARQRKALLAVRHAMKALIASCDAPSGMSEEEEMALIDKTAGLSTTVPNGPTN